MLNKQQMGAKQDAMDDYRSAELDSLQAQINAQRVEIEQLRTRLTSHLNKTDHKEVYAE